MKLFKLFIAIFIISFASFASAQNYSDSEFMGKFNHLSISGNLGTTGYGVDVHMPVNNKLVLRGGINILMIGNITIDATNTLAGLPQIGIIDTKLIDEIKDKKVQLDLKPSLVNLDFLAEYYPWKTSDFHLVGGFYLGTNKVIDVKNTKEGNLKFLYEANTKVMDYNEAFNKNYTPIGLKFGDYIFTADENGNIKANMTTWAVRPYVGVGFGRSVSNIRKCRILFDLGVMFWGKPTIHLNGEHSIKPSGNANSSDALRTISKISAFPVIQIRFAGNIF